MGTFDEALGYLSAIELEVKRHAYKAEHFEKLHEVAHKIAAEYAQIDALEKKRIAAEKSVLDAWAKAEGKIAEAKASADRVQQDSQERIAGWKAQEEDARQRKLAAEKDLARHLQELASVQVRSEDEHNKFMTSLAAEEAEASQRLAAVKEQLNKLAGSLTKTFK